MKSTLTLTISLCHRPSTLLNSADHYSYAQYTPPTPTRLNCRVESRRRRVGVGGVYWALDFDCSVPRKLGLLALASFLGTFSVLNYTVPLLMFASVRFEPLI